MRCYRGNVLEVYLSVRLWHSNASCRCTNHSYRYPEMVDLHAKNLASTLLCSNSQEIQERFNEKLQSFANGEIPHAANVVSTLFGVLAHYRASDLPPETRGPNPRTMARCTWAEGFNHSVPSYQKSMNIALIKSMHRGSFLDMGYRVRKNLAGANQFAFVYLSSGILHGVRSEFDVRELCPPCSVGTN